MMSDIVCICAKLQCLIECLYMKNLFTHAESIHLQMHLYTCKKDLHMQMHLHMQKAFTHANAFTRAKSIYTCKNHYMCTQTNW